MGHAPSGPSVGIGGSEIRGEVVVGVIVVVGHGKYRLAKGIFCQAINNVNGCPRDEPERESFVLSAFAPASLCIGASRDYRGVSAFEPIA